MEQAKADRVDEEVKLEYFELVDQEGPGAQDPQIPVRGREKDACPRKVVLQDLRQNQRSKEEGSIPGKDGIRYLQAQLKASQAGCTRLCQPQKDEHK